MHDQSMKTVAHTVQYGRARSSSRVVVFTGHLNTVSRGPTVFVRVTRLARNFSFLSHYSLFSPGSVFVHGSFTDPRRQREVLSPTAVIYHAN